MISCIVDSLIITLVITIMSLGHDNNAHCLAIAVNTLAGAMFSGYGAIHQRQRMQEFLVVISNLLKTSSYVAMGY